MTDPAGGAAGPGRRGTPGWFPGRPEWIWNTSTGTEQPSTDDGRHLVADTPVGRYAFTWQVDGWRDGPLGLLWRPKYFHPDGLAVHGYRQPHDDLGALDGLHHAVDLVLDAVAARATTVGPQLDHDHLRVFPLDDRAQVLHPLGRK